MPDYQDLSPLSSISLVSFKYWVLLISIGAFCLAVTLWAFFGYIPVTVQGKGIIVSSGGLASVQAKIEGTVENLKVHAGQDVKKGDYLLQIFDPQLELKLVAAETRVKIAQKEFDELREEIKKEKEAFLNASQAKLTAAQFNISQLKNQIKFLTDELKEHQVLLEKGLISGNILHLEEQQLVQKQIDLQDKISEYNELISESKKEYRTEEFRNKEQQLRSTTAQRDQLLVSVNQSQIISPYDGQILEITVNPGDRIQPGTQLVWLEKKQSHTNGTPLIYAYFPIETGERVKLNTTTETTVPQVNSNKYGHIEGKVISISKYAVSYDNIYNRIQNRAIAKSLLGPNAAVVEVIIKPETDPLDPQKIRWTSGKQPPLLLTTGTLADVNATIEKIRPIYYLLPLQQFKYKDDEGKN